MLDGVEDGLWLLVADDDTTADPVASGLVADGLAADVALDCDMVEEASSLASAAG